MERLFHEAFQNGVTLCISTNAHHSQQDAWRSSNALKGRKRISMKGATIASGGGKYPCFSAAFEERQVKRPFDRDHLCKVIIVQRACVVGEYFQCHYMISSKTSSLYSAISGADSSRRESELGGNCLVAERDPQFANRTRGIDLEAVTKPENLSFGHFDLNRSVSLVLFDNRFQSL